MNRLNFLADEPWDEVDGDDRMRVRWFGHPFGADQLGASLIELRRSYHPATSCTSRKDQTGCTRSRTARTSRRGCLASRRSGSQMSSPTRSGDMPGSRPAILSARYPRAATKESSLASSCHRTTEDSRSHGTSRTAILSLTSRPVIVTCAGPGLIGGPSASRVSGSRPARSSSLRIGVPLAPG
jgi:hypothetical protein